MPFPLSHWKLNNHFSTTQPFLVRVVFINSRSLTVRGVLFTCRVTSLKTCIQFRLFINE